MNQCTDQRATDIRYTWHMHRRALWRNLRANCFARAPLYPANVFADYSEELDPFMAIDILEYRLKYGYANKNGDRLYAVECEGLTLETGTVEVEMYET